MKTIDLKTEGTCCRRFLVELDDRLDVARVQHFGGCSGNLDALGMLLVGMNVTEVMQKFEGLRCGSKPTSCMGQLSAGLRRWFKENVRLHCTKEEFMEAVRSLLELSPDGPSSCFMRSVDGDDGVEDFLSEWACMLDLRARVSFQTTVFWCRRKDDRKETMPGISEASRHLGWHEGGFVSFMAGASSYAPVIGFMYVMDGVLMCYVPDDGNVYDRSFMAAYSRWKVPDDASYDYGKAEREFRSVCLMEDAGL